MTSKWGPGGTAWTLDFLKRDYGGVQKGSGASAAKRIAVTLRVRKEEKFFEVEHGIMGNPSFVAFNAVLSAAARDGLLGLQVRALVAVIMTNMLVPRWALRAAKH